MRGRTTGQLGCVGILKPIILPTHASAGNAAKLPELVEPCRQRNIRIVEDAAESLGTVYTSAGSAERHTGTIGDIGCFSFNGNKIITTGGGGMIVTNVPEYADKAKYLTTQAKDDEVRYVHHEIGYNFRLNNVQAAIGVAQLEVLPEYLKIKRANYLAYKNGIEAMPGLKIADTPAYARNNHWMYPLQIDNQVYGKDREALMAYLIGTGANVVQRVNICANCLIGAGATVVSNITIPGTYVGSPARMI